MKSPREEEIFLQIEEVEKIILLNGKLYLSDVFYGWICINTKHVFTHTQWHYGGMLWALVKDFKDFI